MPSAAQAVESKPSEDRKAEHKGVSATKSSAQSLSDVQTVASLQLMSTQCKSNLNLSVIPIPVTKIQSSSSLYSDNEGDVETEIKDEAAKIDKASTSQPPLKIETEAENKEYLRFGANQSLTMHKPRIPALLVSDPTAYNPPDQKLNKMQEIYKGSTSVRGKHSYSNTPIRQRMRHLSSKIRAITGIENEIQCYENDNEIIIATNSNQDLKTIRQINFTTICDPHPKDKKNNGMRIKRHIAKLGKESVKKYFKTKVFIVTNDVDKMKDGFHAERRIKEHVGSFLDPDKLGGQRRPCLACFSVCFDDDGKKRVCPGPLWPSKAATQDARQALLKTIESRQYTFISKAEDGRLRTDQDSDSDSELEPIIDDESSGTEKDDEYRDPKRRKTKK